MATPKTPTQAADEIRMPILEGAPATATPAALKEVLAHLRVFTEKVNFIEADAYLLGNIDLVGHETFRESFQRWADLLAYYEEQVNAAPPDDVAATAHTVYGPLIVGSCYGPPSCSQASADSWAPGGFPMAPTVAQPFILLNMIGAAKEAEEQNKVTTAIGEAIGDLVKAAGEGAGEIIKGIGAAMPDFPKLDIPAWVWPLTALTAGAMIYAAVKD